METNLIKKPIGNAFVEESTFNSKKVARGSSPVSNPLVLALVNEDNKSVTENNALTFKSTLDAVLDFFAMSGALRTRRDDEVIQLFIKAFSQDSLLSLKVLFNLRNVRGGAGERKTFRTLLKYLGNNYSDLVIKNLSNVSFFGREDDLFVLFSTKCEKVVLEYIKDKLEKDIENYQNDKPISLLSKWLPSISTSSANSVKLANIIRRFLNWTPKQYRKTLSTLRSYLNIVEVKMSANQWFDVNYSAVPSKAALNYKDAFKKHDKFRYLAFLNDVKKGNVKINSSTLFPYEIVHKIYFNKDQSETLDSLWDALPNYMEDNTRNILCVCDVSGSMAWSGGQAMSTSIALGIYTAERNKGPFGGYFITYSQSPKLQRVTGNNIREKVACVGKMEAANTDLQAVFKMVLKTAINNNVKQGDMPEQILIISDMEFDNPQNGKTNLDVMSGQYKTAGYKMPQLVFWNVQSRNNNVPALADEGGVLLVSGSSPSVFKTLLSGKHYTPVDQMMEVLNQKMYDRVVV